MNMPIIATVCATVLAFAAPCAQAGNATKEDAVAMVKKGVAHLKASGADKTWAAFNDKKGPFTDRDLYLVAYSMDGKCLAHGANEKMIGRDLLDMTDIDGKYYIKDRVALGKSKPAGFWQDYKFTNPVSKKIEPKSMYCEKAGDTLVCGGVYL